MPQSPIITLTTDFGGSDHFAAAMKGVILGLAPHARIVDISHEITPYEIVEGAFVIAQAWKYFPPASIHVIVVDPGVGSARRPILAQAGGHYFIAPDNGVLSLIYDALSEDASKTIEDPSKPEVRVISNPQFMAAEISRTFHGRDVFAPAAAHLAHGVPAAQFGELIDDYTRIDTAPRQLSPRLWQGIILKIDRFGNLITNFQSRHFDAITTRAFEIRACDHRITRLVSTFSETAVGDPVAIAGSSGYLEIAANQASAAHILGYKAHTPIELEIYD